MKTKIALITGGSRGLGRDMAYSFARQGTDVIITYQSSKDDADKVVQEITDQGRKAVALQLDMSEMEDLDPFMIRLSFALKEVWNAETFDYLINNAGIGNSTPFLEVKEEVFDYLLNVHFKCVYFLTQKAVPLMNNNGSILFISTGTTRFCVPGYSLYASCKGAVEVLCKYIAKEFGSRGIRSNVVAPGPIETDFNNAALRNNPERKNFLASQTPLGRVGKADDIGGVVAFLCSDEGRWINGQRIEVSGGIN
ncbi:MAG TPA: SDR family oxidoreductase [Prolixibacteraceae bacterium]|nr:SDR family oxidoreductase [Prolixibacteraceae bacterium]